MIYWWSRAYSGGKRRNKSRKTGPIKTEAIIKQHLRLIEAKYYTLIQESVEKQLRFQPDVETRNRKPLKRPVVFGAKWEIRFGPDNRFRVFYRVDYNDEQVILLAVGEKIGNRLFIGGEEVEI